MSPANREWHWENGGEIQGPATLDELAASVFRQQIDRDTLVWNSERIFAKPVTELLREFGKLPPEPPITEIAEPAAIAEPLDPAWADTAPHPWRRYFARMIDSTLNGSLVFVAIGAVGGMTLPDESLAVFESIGENRAVDAFLTTLAALPISALLIGFTGTTLGKWLWGVRVVAPNGQPIGFLAAFKRELHVWFSGLALGLPLFSLVTLKKSYDQLSNKGHSSWDAPSEVEVRHRQEGPMQIFLGVCAMLIWICLLLYLRAL